MTRRIPWRGWRVSALGLVTALLLLGCATPGTIGPNGAPDSQEISTLRDRVYAIREGEPLLADVYRLRPLARRPGVLIIHPGGWFSGDKQDVAGMATSLAKAGFVAVAPSYRLAPQHRFPAQIHDVKEAVRWMRAHASQLHVDPDRIAAFGYSSGGHLAALLATSQPADGLEGESAFPGVSSAVQAWVAGGMPADLSAMPANPAVSRLLGGPASELPDLASAASPLRWVSGDDPPAFLYHGRLDAIISSSHARRMQRALEMAGVPARLELGLLGHFSTYLFGRQQEALAAAFLDSWIGGETEMDLAAEIASEPRS